MPDATNATGGDSLPSVTATGRTSDTEVDRLFLDRWSPRAYDGTEMPEPDLRTILDAARWAPSAYNIQPWRILYARRGDADWALFLDLLVPFNQGWAKDSSVLLYFVSEETPSGSDKPSHTHSYDTGAASAQLALQALMLGYHAHGMSGVDFPRAKAELGVPDGYRVEAAMCIGRQADPSILPDALRERERPSDRRPLDQIAFAGKFPAPASS